MVHPYGAECVTQPSLFDPPPIKHADPNLDKREVRRVGGQCLKMLRCFLDGPASNDELSRIGRKYTSRISDLRKSGFRIDKVSQDHETGLAWYRLNAEDREMARRTVEAAK